MARLLQDRFYGVDPFDLTTCLAVTAVRATRVHPDEALRAE